MRLLLLTLALLVQPAFASSRFQSGTTPWDGRQATRNATLLRSAMLKGHNDARRAYGVPALGWSEPLARDAAVYARRLAATAPFAHDPQRGVRAPQGENLFKGTRGAYSYTAIVGLWVDERRWFRRGRFPDVVTSGHWSRVAHYTQIIWPSTRQFGCALAVNAREDFLVCRYLPAGNYFGVMLR
ncbi:MAG: CAP domain-containing protein [Sphingomonadaceae bacterium]